jgi:peptidyl-tRNA hydrolase, PTH1 family
MAFVIVGLGNPEPEYAKTRHNAGRMAVEHFARTHGFPEFTLKKTAHAMVSEGRVEGEKVTLVLPTVSMNLSGKALPAFVKSVKAAKSLLVVRDELDLALGVLKMTTYGRGSGGHRGVESIMRALKTKEFAQLKMGISKATPKGKLKKPEAGEEVIEHVIGKFSPKEMLALTDILTHAGTAIDLFITQGIGEAMLVANTGRK